MFYSFDNLQAAAVSVCQYLASEVHKPTQPEALSDDESISKQPAHKKKSSMPTRPVPVATTNKKEAATKAKVKAEEPPPVNPVVTQIMEMGFPQRHIEHAMQVRLWGVASYICDRSSDLSTKRQQIQR